MTDLTAKQEKFCQEYLIDLNATQATIRAGYSEKTAANIGHENLRKPEIQARITELRKELSEKTKITPEWVLRQAVKVHHRCLQEEQVLDKDGEPIGEYKFEHSGANKALEIIGKHIDVQAFNDRQTVEIVDKASLLERARKRAAESE